MPKMIEPTFTTSTTTYIDAEGRKKKIIHEYTVSTELAREETLKELPPPPAASAPAAAGAAVER